MPRYDWPRFRLQVTSISLQFCTPSPLVLMLVVEPTVNGSLQCLWSRTFRMLRSTMNTEKTAHDHERRRYPHLRAKIPVELKYPGKTPMRTATDEISLSGCYIEMMFTMDVGTKLDLVFSLNQERVAAKGILLSTRPTLFRSSWMLTCRTSASLHCCWDR